LNPYLKLNQKRTAEPQNIEYGISKAGIAALSLLFWNRCAQSFIKIDRMHYFDIRHSLFDIRQSLFQSFYFDLAGRFWD